MGGLPYAILGFAYDREDVQAAIDAATDISERQIRTGRAPLWWNDSARYARERHTTLPGVERIQTAEELTAMGRGDCDDHAPALAASLRVAGIPARAVVIDSPGVGYHVIVAARNADGELRVVDPSARRGMLEPESMGAAHHRRRRHGHKAKAALARAAQLIAEVERMNPYTAAARALAGEASRLLDVAHAEGQAAEAEGEDEP